MLLFQRLACSFAIASLSPLEKCGLSAFSLDLLETEENFSCLWDERWSEEKELKLSLSKERERESGIQLRKRKREKNDRSSFSLLTPSLMKSGETSIDHHVVFSFGLLDCNCDYSVEMENIGRNVSLHVLLRYLSAHVESCECMWVTNGSFQVWHSFSLLPLFIKSPIFVVGYHSRSLDAFCISFSVSRSIAYILLSPLPHASFIPPANCIEREPYTKSLQPASLLQPTGEIVNENWMFSFFSLSLSLLRSKDEKNRQDVEGENRRGGGCGVVVWWFGQKVGDR